MTQHDLVEQLREGFTPCPTCGQYSHSIGEGPLTDAFNHFQSMFSHRGDGIPTKFSFDEKTRDAAQVLIAAAKAPARLSSEQTNTPPQSDLQRKLDMAVEALELNLPIMEEDRRSLVECNTMPINDISTLDPDVQEFVEAYDAALAKTRSTLLAIKGGSDA